MSRRKQTKPRAIKRDVSHDDEENLAHSVKKFNFEVSYSTETIDPSNDTNESRSLDDEQISTAIKCDSCQESFLTSEQFNQHRLYQCSFLPEVNVSDESQTSSSLDEFARQIDTIPHSTKQTEEYPHACSYCQKSFSNMALLLKHEQVHVELMPFRCSFCGKGFKHRRSLNRHLKLHTGERKFKCPSCESTFARSDHLKAHIRTHNNGNNTNHHHSNSNSNNSLIEKKTQLDCRTKILTNGKNRRVSSEIKTNKDEIQTEQCPYCPRICLGEDSLKLHIQNDHQQQLNAENPLKNDSSSDNYCYLCNAKFNTRENYIAHLRCVHTKTRPSKTDSTTLIVPSSTKSAENDLFEYALIEKTIWCEKCKRVFDSMNTYLQHYSIQHCLQMIKCLQCQDMFESIDSFFDHIEKVHPSKTVETLKCKLCNASYKNRNDFLHHVKNSHRNVCSSNSCPLCSFQSTNNVELYEHLKFSHQIDSFDQQNSQTTLNPIFSCKICSIKLNSRFELNHHILNEHDDQRQEKKFCSTSNEEICSFCDLKFSNEFSLIEHQRVAHRSTFQCAFCQTSFTSRAQLDRHSKIHVAASGTNLKCNICDRAFSTIEILSEHKLSHCKATTSNVCSHCQKILQNENDFIRHFFEHNQNLKNNKLFSTQQDGTTTTIVCIVCKQSLINERELELHGKFHLSDQQNKKNFQSNFDFHCRICQKSTGTSRDFLIELPSFTFHCFNCLRKQFQLNVENLPEKQISNLKISCPKCRTNVEFDNLKIYEQHLNNVHRKEMLIDEFHCLKCKKIVSSSEHIFQHCSNDVASKSSNFLIDNLQSSGREVATLRVNHCYLCRTNFETSNQMNLHLIEHQYPNRDYQCSLCENVRFENGSQLYQHMIQHGTAARLFPCRECDVFFMFSMHLINHQYSHTDATVFSLGNFQNNGTIDEQNEFRWKSFVDRSSTNKSNSRSVVVN